MQKQAIVARTLRCALSPFPPGFITTPAWRSASKHAAKPAHCVLPLEPLFAASHVYNVAEQ